MKKKIIAILLLLAVLACTACAGEKPDASTIDIYKLGAEVSAVIKFEDSMKLSTDSALSFFDLVSGSISEGYFEVDDGLNVSSVFIAKTPSAEAAESLQKAMQTYLDSLKKQYESYLPEEYQKLKDVQVKTYDTIVYYGIGNDAAAIDGVFSRYFK